MSKGRKTSGSGALLELWRPPQDAGDPVGCLASTYTFAPGLFDEQCLARFLEIESEPNREDLAFLLERADRLGSIYAGVLVDHTQAGVEHSLRWDILPVRIPAGKQHSKVSLLVWGQHIRVIVASANLTEPGYRLNHEVATAVDLSPRGADVDVLASTVNFMRALVGLVPGASMRPPEIQRVERFLGEVEHKARAWTQNRRRTTMRQHIACTLPSVAAERPARSSLDEAVRSCRLRGGSPHEAWVASPFFDPNDDSGQVAASLCKVMARGRKRKVRFCVPAVSDEASDALPRLAAPRALVTTPRAYNADVRVEVLPDRDADKNRRLWHAKMVTLLSADYFALMVGSSNFTSAGMGIGRHRNAEANLLTIMNRVDYGRDVGKLETVWPETTEVKDPDSAEWLGARPDEEEENQATAVPLPAGFLSATYRAGVRRQIVLRLNPSRLPLSWSAHACGREECEILSASTWKASGAPPVVEVAWDPVLPPEKLLVYWGDHSGWLPLNVEDGRELPPPADLKDMSADDLLRILGAADPGAAFRAWARRQRPSEGFDADLDSATAIDLDPLQRYDLQATFLHRIRRRARVLAQLRANLQRPVWGKQALEWRLRGLVGVETLADRLVGEFVDADDASDEALLTLADFMIVMREVDYQPSEGSLSKQDFEEAYRPFLGALTDKLRRRVSPHYGRVSGDLKRFWEGVLERCRG